MKLTLEKIVEKLKDDCGKNLVSIILYGSAAAGDYAGKKSDYNLMVIARSLEVSHLLQISKSAHTWVKQGNPPPLLFTWERLKRSLDVFPVELADIKENHKILFGEDSISNLAISYENLRLELEHELKGKLIQLRERFLFTEGNSKLVEELMVQTLSTFLVLFKNALRLYNEKPPLKKMDALAELNKHIPCDMEVFGIVNRLKQGEKIKALDRVKLFERYLKAVENVVDAVDQHSRHTSA